jgi:hypothetical protein
VLLLAARALSRTSFCGVAEPEISSGDEKGRSRDIAHFLLVTVRI